MGKKRNKAKPAAGNPKVTPLQIMQEMSDQIRREEADSAAKLHLILDSLGNLDGPLKSNTYRMLCALQKSAIGVLIPWVGDGHMGNLARNSHFADEFLEGFKQVVYIEKCHGDIKQFTKYLADWAKEVEQQLNLVNGSISNEESIIQQGLIAKPRTVDRSIYNHSITSGSNDVRRKGNRFIQYSFANEESKSLVDTFLKTNQTLVEISAKIEAQNQTESKVAESPQKIRQKRNKNTQDIFIDALLENCNANYDKAAKNFETFIEKNNGKDKKAETEAYENLTQIYLAQSKLSNDNKVLQDQYYQKLAHYAKILADKNFPHYQYFMGILYNNASGVDRNYNESAKYFTKALKQGHSGANFEMGILFANGRGVKQSYSLAFHHFSQAANQGNVEALHSVGQCYLFGNGVDQNLATARRHLCRAAELGNRNAQNKMGTIYVDGIGVAKDYKMAAKYYEMAALQGEPSCQNVIGSYYELGLAGTKNLDKAAKFYKMSAGQGNLVALTNLGILYCNPNYSGCDLKKSTECLESALAKGYQDAAHNLKIVKGFIEKKNQQNFSNQSFTQKPQTSIHSSTSTPSPLQTTHCSSRGN